MLDMKSIESHREKINKDLVQLHKEGIGNRRKIIKDNNIGQIIQEWLNFNFRLMTQIERQKSNEA
ncbi:hypothetical protein pb186bvf_015918 [Paramecium bursaria]